ncbi:MAG: hypothetical protein ACLGI2_09070 [Acidimicrobiia bacterium]
MSNGGGAAASTGGNSSTGNNSTNVASNTNTASTPTESPSLVGGLLGLVGNVAGGNTANASTGTSAVNTGPAQASGNNSNTAVNQTSTETGGGPVVHHGPSPVVGAVFGSPVLAPVSSQGATVSNSGDAAASTGGNAGVGNNSSNVATTQQTVSGGLIAIGLNVLGGNATNTSSGTSAINTGPASAAGNTSTTGVNQTSVDGGGFGPGTRFGIGGGAACDGFFGFGGQRVNVSNAGTAEAATGNNTSVGNQSTNVASNTMNVSGGLIGLGLNLLGGNATNTSDGASAITTGAAAASGNTSSTSVNQQCVELQPVRAGGPVFHHGPPSITPHVVKLGHPVHAVKHQQLARTGVDPFVLGLIAFSLLFGGLLFMVWERVEAYPAKATPPTA